MNGYGDIAANDEDANNFYIICCASVPYTLQGYVESNGNQCSSGELVWNEIYTSPVLQKSRISIESCKIQDCNCANKESLFYKSWR